MAFKSEQQRKKFGALVKQGKMSQATFDEFNKATGNKVLPERVEKKKKTEKVPKTKIKYR